MGQRMRACAAGVAAIAAVVGSMTAACADGGSDMGLTVVSSGTQVQGDGTTAGKYPNLFAEAGYSQAEIDARVEAAWQQLFHGDGGESSGRLDGQSIYYTLSDDMAYVEDIGNTDARSEGLGYAMMIAVQLDHQKEFNALWNFAKSKMQVQSGSTKYFFAWHTDTNGKIIDSGIAPDGDQWISAALAFAANRWGNGQGIYDYATEAKQIVRAMWHNADSGGVNMFDSSTGLPFFSPPGVTNFSDPSYCLPTFYTVYAKLVPEDAALWQKASQGCRQLFQKASNPTTGLFPCYSDFDGTPNPAPWGGTSEDAYGRTYQEDAWRVIANVNMDAAWNGAQPWHTTLSDRMATFFAKQGITSYVSRFRVDGTPVVTGQNTYEPAHAEGIVAMNSTMAMTATHSARLEFVRDFWNTKVPSGRARYYDGLLYMLGLLYDSGQFRAW